jgi:hypothetical protein
MEPSTAAEPPLHRYLVRALRRERERHKLEMFARLARPGFHAAVVEAEALDFAQAGD